MNLASLILQTAIAVMTFINSNPGIPQWQHDQGVAIAQQALQFANQTVGYNTNTYNPNTYNPNCSGYSNCNYSNCTTNSYGYQACPSVNANNNIQILVLGAENMDSSFVQNGKNYSIVWSPFDASLGYANVQLANTSTGAITTIGSMNGNTISWYPSGFPTGNYTIRVTQQGSIIGTRSITVQY